MKKVVGICGAMVALSACAWPLGAAISKPVKVTGGTVAGVPGKDASVTVFKGLPYAAPPVGDLRWHAPKPLAPWQGVKKADQFGNSCIQNIVTLFIAVVAPIGLLAAHPRRYLIQSASHLDIPTVGIRPRCARSGAKTPDWPSSNPEGVRC